MSKILIIAGNCRQGHAADRLALQIKAFKDEGHEVIVKTSNGYLVNKSAAVGVTTTTNPVIIDESGVIDEFIKIGEPRFESELWKVIKNETSKFRVFKDEMDLESFAEIHFKPEKNWDRKGRFPVTKKVKK